MEGPAVNGDMGRKDKNMTAGQLSNSGLHLRKHRKLRSYNIGLTKERWEQVRDYAEQENIFISQALEMMVDAYFLQARG